ncbi:hypothetical protein, partial [Klebsiella quasipneumoniae]|uniref:hypothetical protein n=1 Tax=Klebsiella quasipneumoniae TaxID=1463165 RepID=UPI003EE50863
MTIAFFWLMTNLFRYCARMSAGWRLSPYPAYKRLQDQTVMPLSVGPRKRSAAGQSQKIALFRLCSLSLWERAGMRARS